MTDPGHPSPVRRRGTVVLAVLVTAFLTLQIAVPAIALLGPRPVRFAWHMYTVFAPPPSVWTETSDGDHHELDLNTILADSRPEMEHGRVLLSTLCAQSEVEAIVVEYQVGDRSRLPCS